MYNVLRNGLDKRVVDFSVLPDTMLTESMPSQENMERFLSTMFKAKDTEETKWSK